MNSHIPQIDLAIILKDQNPHIDLKTHTYENSTKNFLKALTSYKNRAITTISDRRKHQVSEKKKLIEKTHAVEAETNHCKIKEIELVSELEKEKEEKQEMELSVAAFKRQLASLRDKGSPIDSEIEQYRAITDNLRREKNKDRSILRKHASHMTPDLEFCQHWLSCVIEGIENDHLLVRFSRIYPSDAEMEASLVIDISNRGCYRVLTSTPHLPSLHILVNSLNETGDIYDFLKQLRDKYRELLQDPDS